MNGGKKCWSFVLDWKCVGMIWGSDKHVESEPPQILCLGGGLSSELKREKNISMQETEKKNRIACFHERVELL